MSRTDFQPPGIIPIELEGVRFRYGRSAILRGIDLRVDAGEIVVLFGANGSGKTTLFSILTGLAQPSDGVRRYGGRVLLEVDEVVRAQMAYVAHGPQLFPLLTARENLELIVQLYGSYGVQTSSVDEIVQRVGLAGHLDTAVAKFSRGMAQRLALGRALAMSPAALLLDEPFTALDRAGQTALRSILLEEKNRGTAIFFASHDLNVIDDLADRVLCLDGGLIHAIWSRESATEFSSSFLQQSATESA